MNDEPQVDFELVWDLLLELKPIGNKWLQMKKGTFRTCLCSLLCFLSSWLFDLGFGVGLLLS